MTATLIKNKPNLVRDKKRSTQQRHLQVISVLLIMVFSVVSVHSTRFMKMDVTVSVCLSVLSSVCPSSVQIHVRPITFYWFDIGLPYLAHGCFTIKLCATYIHDPDMTLNFGHIYRVFDMFSCQAYNLFLDWQWLTIFCTWVYHHKTLCCVHSWSRFDVDLWPQGQIYRLFSCFPIGPVTSVSFDSGKPYSEPVSITMKGCVKYIYDPDTTLNFDFKVKFIGFMTWLCVQASAFFCPLT